MNKRLNRKLTESTVIGPSNQTLYIEKYAKETSEDLVTQLNDAYKKFIRRRLNGEKEQYIAGLHETVEDIATVLYMRGIKVPLYESFVLNDAKNLNLSE